MEQVSSTLVYITVPAEGPLGVRVTSIIGHTQVMPGQSVVFAVTDTQGIEIALDTSDIMDIDSDVAD